MQEQRLGKSLACKRLNEQDLIERLEIRSLMASVQRVPKLLKTDGDGGPA